ncbi:MAG: acyl-CoA dehydrogenase C-terminal domain-containing protein, partial [Actinomycetes bacterium]
KIVKDGGRAIGLLGKEIQTFAESGGALGDEKAQLLTSLGDLNAIIATLVGHAMASQEKSEEIYKVGLNTTRLLMAVGDIICAWLLIRQGVIAEGKLATASAKDKDFYTGKIAAAKFFVSTVLPRITSDRKIIEVGDGEIMNLSESAF